MAGSLTVSLAGCGGPGSDIPGHGGGQSSVSYAGYAGPTLLSADQRTVTVAGFTYPCFGTLRPIARETRTRVALWLRYVTPVHHGVCTMDLAMEGPRNIRLSAPLGSRLLVDGATGRSLRWFDVRQMIRPAAIPAGYKLHVVTPLVTGSQPAPATPGCRQDYQYRGGTLSIIQSAGSLELPQAGGRAPAASQVRGHPGLASAYAIRWREAGYNVLIEAFPETGKAPVFTTAALIAIADSAPPGEPA
ncbi:MAG: hypothetical protein LBI49_07050 [Nocardiopsaceae bacterium]|nr:hypothetical protein [Nocardiopsaceae bacterium]